MSHGSVFINVSFHILGASLTLMALFSSLCHFIYLELV